MDTLDSDNIFTDEEVTRILGEIDSPEKESEETINDGDNEDQEEEVAEEEFLDEFSDREPSESVGSRTPESEQQGSPANIFNSIASALREEGVFPDLDDATLNEVKDARSFRQLIDKQIASGLDERQRRIDDALSNGVQPSEIQQYEGALAYLNQITDEALTANSEQGEDLRKRIIYQDLINRGYSQEKAVKEIKKSLDAGTDIDDARDAYAANKEFFQSRYNALIENAKQQRQKAQAYYNTRAKNFEKSLLEDEKVFGSVEIDNATRKRVLDVLTKPTKRDDNGRYYTELQWAQASDADAFSRNVGLLYVLTDGFKNVDKLINQQVKRGTKKGLDELERTLNSTQRGPDGSLRLMSGTKSDPESLLSGDFELDPLIQ